MILSCFCWHGGQTGVDAGHISLTERAAAFHLLLNQCRKVKREVFHPNQIYQTFKKTLHFIHIKTAAASHSFFSNCCYKVTDLEGTWPHTCKYEPTLKYQQHLIHLHLHPKTMINTSIWISCICSFVALPMKWFIKQHKTQWWYTVHLSSKRVHLFPADW